MNKLNNVKLACHIGQFVLSLRFTAHKQKVNQQPFCLRAQETRCLHFWRMEIASDKLMESWAWPTGPARRPTEEEGGKAGKKNERKKGSAPLMTGPQPSTSTT